MSEGEPYRPFPTFGDWRETSVDLTKFDLFASRFAEWRETLTQEDLRHSIDVATKWAAVDTGAIEALYDVDRNFTFTVAAEAAAWDNIHLAKGEKVERAINDALAAYEYVLEAVTEKTPISEMWIRQLHQIVCASQDTYSVITAAGRQEQPFPKGTYKTMPNNPFNLAQGVLHAYAPVTDTPAEMNRLVQEMRSADFLAAPPPLQAAYAHCAFVCIHPFADGNGRVSRALASVFLYRSPGVPLVIFADQKSTYIDGLEAADGGVFGPFADFIVERAVDTMEMLRAGGAPSRRTLASAVDAVNRGMAAPAGLTPTEADDLALRLLAEFTQALNRARQENDLGPYLSHEVVQGPFAPAQPPPAGYRAIPDDRNETVSLTGSAAQPAQIHRGRTFSVGVARPGQLGSDFVVYQHGEIVLGAFIRDLSPTISQSLQYRLLRAAERQFEEVMTEIAEQAQRSL